METAGERLDPELEEAKERRKGKEGSKVGCDRSGFVYMSYDIPSQVQ